MALKARVATSRLRVRFPYCFAFWPTKVSTSKTHRNAVNTCENGMWQLAFKAQIGFLQISENFGTKLIENNADEVCFKLGCHIPFQYTFSTMQ